jgi:hypothetical protein
LTDRAAKVEALRKREEQRSPPTIFPADRDGHAWPPILLGTGLPTGKTPKINYAIDYDAA